MGELSLNINCFISEQFPLAIKQCINDCCQDVANSAKEKCPVDDGPLRASIKHKVEKDKNKFIGTVGTNVEYAPYVHEGTGLYAKEGNGRKEVPWTYKTADGHFYKTSGQHPNPFLQEAVDENMQNILNRFEGCLDDS
ncbi:MAG: HK97 gp10 family phage protein [Clostridia bacterium]|jgi:hypothetical protein|nr:HK97 gp10 family phage protein [Clostridia bacterium]